ncbi:MAG: Gfo/Idh/MocA family oxidoreductase [Isosphaeraceae bacterium]|nr:Gfo/Idh/MocA family oxidoreductase [Isosphaeraceae bacterium]
MSIEGDSDRIRLGIIGLGRLWQVRHRPALERLGDRFRITAIHDAVAARAKREAARIGCAAAGGLRALVERTDVDALLISTPSWFGLHPIRIACEVGKPVYAAPAAALEPEARAAVIDAEVRAAGIAVVPEFARRLYPTTIRLRELIANELGPPRLVLCQTRVPMVDRDVTPGPTTQVAPAPLVVDPGAFLIDWTRQIFGRTPDRVAGEQTHLLVPPGGEPDYQVITARYSDGAVARHTIFRFHRDAWGEPAGKLGTPGIQVFAERGSAWIDPPDRIVWTTPSGTRDERLPVAASIGEQLLLGFHAVVKGDRSAAPSWTDAIESARLVAAARSRAGEGVEIAESAT